jgi:hypothetical protein
MMKNTAAEHKNPRMNAFSVEEKQADCNRR